jgi:hypothetical protein
MCLFEMYIAINRFAFVLPHFAGLPILSGSYSGLNTTITVVRYEMYSVTALYSDMNEASDW